jgi:murein DD-endopeptidase MepM/ murein hydrolase activator NlpD
MRRSINAIAAALTVAIILPAVVLSAWPVANRQSYISQYFHKGHRADDIAAAAGTRVVPMKSGHVVFAGRKHNCGGKQVWLSHGNGLDSAYYPLRSIGVSRGQHVRRSQTRLGRSGQTGCADGPHVHVEVWRGFPWGSGSYRVNPWKRINSGYWLPYRYR